MKRKSDLVKARKKTRINEVVEMFKEEISENPNFNKEVIRLTIEKLRDHKTYRPKDINYAVNELTKLL